MGTTQIAPEITLDTIVLPQDDAPIMCESQLEVRILHMDPHPATWFVRCPCGLVIACCESRRLWALKCNGVWCDLGCMEMHAYEDIAWVPIGL